MVRLDILMRPVYQWVVVREFTWGAKYSLRKAVGRFTGPLKTLKNPIIRGFCDWRDPAAPAEVLFLGDEMWERAALALRLSLRHNPLVNSVAVCAESPRQGTLRATQVCERQACLNAHKTGL